MKKYIKTLFISTILSLFMVMGMVSVASAFITPSLSLVNLDNSYVKISVNADSYSPVSLYYYVNSLYPQNVGNIGSTDYNGNFTATISNSQYNIPYGAYVYVAVNGVSSPNIMWTYSSNYNNNYQNYYPNYNNTTPISLSQNILSLTVGQSVSINVYGNGGSYYISNNTNPQVATASINGSMLSVYGSGVGAANVTVCQYNNGSCVVLYMGVTSNAITYQPYYQYTQPAAVIYTQPVISSYQYSYTQPTMQYRMRNIFPRHFNFWNWRVW